MSEKPDLSKRVLRQPATDHINFAPIGILAPGGKFDG